MKHTRLAFILVIISCASTPVFAASMAMLQFGSFETREEAEKRLNEIKSKHAAQVGSLPTMIREIKLPPDNLTVYRTQAGPLENRAAAQAVCSKLASAGDECYVVQTAMVAAEKMTAPQVAAAVSAPVASAAVPVASAAVADAVPVVRTPLAEIPSRDASNRAALASLSKAAPVMEQPAAAEPSTALKAALDKAVEDQSSAATAVDKAAAAENTASKPSRSFWSRLNPFGGDDKPATVAAKAPAPQPIAAPVEKVTEQAVAPAVIEYAPAAPEIPTKAVATVVVPAAPAALPVMPSVTLPSITAATPVAPTVPAMQAAIIPSPAIVMDTMPVITQAEPMRLPPPPAPLSAQDLATLAAATKAQAEKPEPIAAAPIVASEIKTPEVAAVTSGVVNVEEAKRVPLTQLTTPPAVVAAPAPIEAPVVLAPPEPVVLPPALMPSSTTGVKTMWAQIGPFADSDAALAFWAGYRQAHPDFPVVRVRVTTPYQQKLKGSNTSWLRVGPVTRAGFITNLCDGISWSVNVNCGRVMDMGIASPAAGDVAPVVEDEPAVVEPVAPPPVAAPAPVVPEKAAPKKAHKAKKHTKRKKRTK